MKRIIYSFYIDIPKDELDILDKNILKKNNFYEFRINNKVKSIYNFKGLTYTFDNYLKLNTFIKTIINNSFLKRKYYKNCKLSYSKAVDHNFKYFENFRVLFN